MSFEKTWYVFGKNYYAFTMEIGKHTTNNTHLTWKSYLSSSENGSTCNSRKVPTEQKV